MQPLPLTQLAARLYDLRHTGQIIPLANAGIGDGSAPDDWKPKEKYCHDNVDIWVARSPEYEAVRGWVVFEEFSTNPLFRANPFVRFAAHSIICAPDGKLWDITPQPMVSRRYPFIRHPDTNENFDDLRRDYGVMNIDYYLASRS
jgi:hypothetical protein